uniref:ATP synthase F0 subunit 8 n=1 Tax=Hiratettix distanti TaxID=2893146 RepID=A0A9E6XQF1_9HEMI|nr:ATP synthase F0 subunit 8 [Hiratettix distanti]UGN61526.1 ATP synthase F0 subunit 8 [Hiratettix distanti]
MPQMSPMMWTTLMFMFLISLLMCMYMLYFNYKKLIKFNKKIMKLNMNWSW